MVPPLELASGEAAAPATGRAHLITTDTDATLDSGVYGHPAALAWTGRAGSRKGGREDGRAELPVREAGPTGAEPAVRRRPRARAALPRADAVRPGRLAGRPLRGRQDRAERSALQPGRGDDPRRAAPVPDEVQ